MGINVPESVWDLSPEQWAILVENYQSFDRIDRHSGTVCGCIKRCVYDGGTGYGHRKAVERGDEPKYTKLTWD